MHGLEYKELFFSFLEEDKTKKKIINILMEDEDLIGWLKEKIFKNENSRENIENKKLIEKLKDEIKELKNINEKYEKRYMESQNEIKNILNEKEKIQREYEEEFAKLSGVFQEEKRIFKIYKSLDGKMRNELDEIFKGDSIEDFICCGVQYKNIDMLWEISKRAVLAKEENFQGTVEIFNYFFEKFSKTYKVPLYRKLSVSIEDKFDPNYHISCGSASGYVEKIYLNGYMDRDRKVIKKAVVEL